MKPAFTFLYLPIMAFLLLIGCFSGNGKTAAGQGTACETVTVFGPQIKEGALFVGQRVKDISGLVSGTIPSGPDGYLFLTYKKDIAISIQLDISGVAADSRLVTGLSEMADVPDSLRVESLVIMAGGRADVSGQAREGAGLR